jgi:nucleoside-diphosphate-sugar epimerase
VKSLKESKLTDRKVLVTGGAGFIGSHIVDQLVASGARVRVLDNFETGKRQNLSHLIDQIELVEGDIRDLGTCGRAMRDIELVSHQAALGSVPRSLATPATTMAANLCGAANIFQAARDAGIRRVVYASSSSVYGDSATLPRREGAEGRALSPYALSKAMDEQLAEMFHRCFGMEVIGLRYFNVYGPRQAPKGPYAAVIPRYFDACLAARPLTVFGTGEQSRDFTYVGDVARINLVVLGAAAAEPGAYNVGAGERTTVNRLAKDIMEIAGSSGPIEYSPARPGDVLHSHADTTRLEMAFGERPRTSLAEGLAQSAAYYLKNSSQ